MRDIAHQQGCTGVPLIRFDAKRLADHLGDLAKSDLDGLAVVGLEGDALLVPFQALRKINTPVVINGQD